MRDLEVFWRVWPPVTVSWEEDYSYLLQREVNYHPGQIKQQIQAEAVGRKIRASCWLQNSAIEGLQPGSLQLCICFPEIATVGGGAKPKKAGSQTWEGKVGNSRFPLGLELPRIGELNQGTRPSSSWTAESLEGKPEAE